MATDTERAMSKAGVAIVVCLGIASAIGGVVSAVDNQGAPAFILILTAVICASVCFSNGT